MITWAYIKKYAKYIVIILVGIFAVIAWIMISSWWKKLKANENAGMSEGTETLTGVITEIGGKMTEADHQASVEIAVARGNENVTKGQLKETVGMKDKTKRRENLAAMYTSTK